MTRETKETIKRHIHSSVITFLTFFLPLLGASIQDLSFETLETAGFVGAMGILIRLVIKVGYESLRKWLVTKR